MTNKNIKIPKSRDFNVRTYQSGWIATRKADKLKVYFEDFKEMLKFIFS